MEPIIDLIWTVEDEPEAGILPSMGGCIEIMANCGRPPLTPGPSCSVPVVSVVRILIGNC